MRAISPLMPTANHLNNTSVITTCVWCCKDEESCQCFQNILYTAINICLFFKSFPQVRSIVSDFAVLIAIIVMALVDLIFKVNTPKLKIPQRFEPTASDKRGWLVDPLGYNPAWSIIAASIPAILSTILVFMDQQITALIVNRREHKLKVEMPQQLFWNGCCRCGCSCCCSCCYGCYCSCCLCCWCPPDVCVAGVVVVVVALLLFMFLVSYCSHWCCFDCCYCYCYGSVAATVFLLFTLLILLLLLLLLFLP